MERFETILRESLSTIGDAIRPLTLMLSGSLDTRLQWWVVGGAILSVLALFSALRSASRGRRLQKEVTDLSVQLSEMRASVSRIEQIENRRFLADLRIGDAGKAPPGGSLDAKSRSRPMQEERRAMTEVPYPDQSPA